MIAGPSAPAPAPPTAAELLLKVPPNSEAAEQALLGSIFLDPEALGSVVALLRPEDFYRSQHRKIYEICLALYERSEPADALLVLREAERRGIAEEIGGQETLTRLVSAVSTPANAEHYALVIREKALARGLVQVASEIQRAALSEEQRGEELIDWAEHQVFALARAQDLGRAVSVSTLVHEVIQELDSRTEVTGIPTGFHQLDDMTGGLKGGELVIVAGRPSMGKTTFALNVAYNVAVHGHTPTLFFSLEMSRKQITKNILCAHAQIEGRQLRSGKFLSNADYEKLISTAGPLYDAPLYVDDTPSMNTTSLRAKARRMQQKHDVKLIVIDYLQLMEAMTTSKNVENRQQEISYISRSLKALARELNVPVIAISQLNRAADARDDHRPRLSDLRESGALEQDADLICFLFRPFYYTKSETDRGIAEVIVAKQRNGPTDTVRLAFLDRFMLFDNLAFPSQSEPPA